MAKKKETRSGMGRRDFLKAAGLAGVGAAAGSFATCRFSSSASRAKSSRWRAMSASSSSE